MTRTMLTTADRIHHALRAMSLSVEDAAQHLHCAESDLAGGYLTPEQIEALATFVGFPVEWFRGELPTMDDGVMLLGAVVTAGPENLRLRGRAPQGGLDQGRARA